MRTIKYAVGTATNSITIQNLYKYGGTVWIFGYLAIGFVEVGSFTGALSVLLDAYIMKLLGWPWDELLLADSLSGLIRSHVQTWIAGWATATIKYGINS